MSSQPAAAGSEKSQARPAVHGYGCYAAPAPLAGKADAAPPRGALVSYVEEFNSILKRMTSELAIRYPSDATIGRAKKRILLAMELDPVSIINTVGPHLFQYREGIYAGNADFFIENDYDAELQRMKNADKADLVTYIIPKVKAAWKVSDAGQRDAYKAKVQELLDIYLDYLAVRHARC